MCLRINVQEYSKHHFLGKFLRAGFGSISGSITHRAENQRDHSVSRTLPDIADFEDGGKGHKPRDAGGLHK